MAGRGLNAMRATEIRLSDIQRRIDPQAVLDYYEADNQYTQTNTDGTVEVIHSCLIDRVDPHHRNGDSSPSAACNLDKKTWVCYSYADSETGKSGYDMLHLIMKMEGKSDPYDVLDVVRRFLAEAVVEDQEDFAAEMERLLTAGTEPSTPIRAYSDRLLEPWGYTHPWTVERGIDLNTASRLHIGYDPHDNRITIPHFWRGALVGWQKRAIPDRPGQWPGTVPPLPKYRSSPGFPKSETLYRFDEARAHQADRGGPVVVVESPFSVVNAESIGLSGVTATFGAKITATQAALLSSAADIVVWMDGDGAGWLAERRLVQALYRYTTVRVVIPEGTRDLGDYRDLDEVRELIDAAVPAQVMLARYDEEKEEWATRGLAYELSTRERGLLTIRTGIR